MIIVDTTVLVDLLRKYPKTLEFIHSLGAIPLVTTEISVMELVFGITGSKIYIKNPELKEKRLSEIRDLLMKFTILSFDHRSAYTTAEIMGKLKLRGKMIDFRDGMIAGITLANGLSKIITHNIDHFKRISDLELIFTRMKSR